MAAQHGQQILPPTPSEPPYTAANRGLPYTYMHALYRAGRRHMPPQRNILRVVCMVKNVVDLDTYRYLHVCIQMYYGTRCPCQGGESTQHHNKAAAATRQATHICMA